MAAQTAGGPARPNAWRRRALLVLRVLGVVVLILGVLVVYLLVKRVDHPATAAAPDPARTFDDALAKFAGVAAREASEDLNPDCRSRLITSGQRSDRAIVLIHGYTNCPAMMARFGQLLADAGYNVYIPLIPDHGGSDQRRSTLAALTTEKLMSFGNESLDIATGLGEKVTVFGLSGGGIVAGYLAQTRADVDLAVLVAPFLGPKGVPAWATPGLINLADLLPPIGVLSPDAGDGTVPTYESLDTNTKAAAAFMRLGDLVLAQAATSPRAAVRSITVTNAADDTVNNELADELTRRWQSRSPGTSAYMFAADLEVPHDMIGPDRADQKTDLSYPILLELLGLH